MQSSALVSRHIFFSTSTNQAAFLGHRWLIRQNQAANAQIDGATPSYLARTWPKNSGALLGANLGRKRAPFIEGYVGPLGALLAAFEPKMSTPTEAWFRWGWILGQFWAYVGPFGGYLKTRVVNFIILRVLRAHFGAFLGLYSLLCWAILGLCWALLAAFGPKISTPTEALWLRWAPLRLNVGSVSGSN